MPWYADWFNAPYYHILYHYRNQDEAKVFISNLMQHLNLPAGSHVLDLACGRGRHSIYLHKLGFHVVGVDLSVENIAYARKFSDQNLEFHVHDMRQVFRENYFDAVLNLFTSFGYFKNDEDHEQTLRSAYQALRAGGLFVLDFFNIQHINQTLVPYERKIIDEIRFDIRRHSDGMYIYKTIEVFDHGRVAYFQERVRAFTKEDLEQLIQRVGFIPTQCFGNYSLMPYQPHTSERCIWVAKKP